MASFASAPGSGTIRTGDGTVTVNPSAPYSGLVILMHGLGDSAEGFADVAEMWARRYARSEATTARKERSDEPKAPCKEELEK